jgi:predicted Fe-Mo cluster-binding NifX family protein
MKIAITSTGDTLEDRVAFRLGRNAFYLVVDTESLEVEPIENPDRVNNQEASEQCAGLMRDRQVRAVVTGHCGPGAYKVFGGVGITVVPGITGTAVDFVHGFRQSPGLYDIPEETPVMAEPGSGRKHGKSVGYEEYLQLKAEVVVMQRKLLDLQRRVKKMES